MNLRALLLGAVAMLFSQSVWGDQGDFPLITNCTISSSCSAHAESFTFDANSGTFIPDFPTYSSPTITTIPGVADAGHGIIASVDFQADPSAQWLQGNLETRGTRVGGFPIVASDMFPVYWNCHAEAELHIEFTLTRYALLDYSVSHVYRLSTIEINNPSNSFAASNGSGRVGLVPGHYLIDAELVYLIGSPTQWNPTVFPDQSASFFLTVPEPSSFSSLFLVFCLRRKRTMH